VVDFWNVFVHQIHTAYRLVWLSWRRPAHEAPSQSFGAHYTQVQIGSSLLIVFAGSPKARCLQDLAAIHAECQFISPVAGIDFLGSFDSRTGDSGSFKSRNYPYLTPQTLRYQCILAAVMDKRRRIDLERIREVWYDNRNVPLITRRCEGPRLLKIDVEDGRKRGRGISRDVNWNVFRPDGR
jgi:hypothetical protein